MTGEVGVERLLPAEGSEHSAFPDEQVAVVRSEFFPDLVAAGTGHALAYQKQVRQGDGLSW